MNFHERSRMEEKEREDRERRERAKLMASDAALLLLQPGAIVRHKASGEAHVVTANYGDHLVAVRTQHVTNSGEWEIVHHGPFE